MAQDFFFRHARVMVLVLAVLVVAMGGCSSTAPSRFFELSPLATSTSKMDDGNRSLTVGITRIGMPDYLDKPQIATRIGPNEIRYDEFNRWAGSLKESFSRVLVENLSNLLGTQKVIIDTWIGMVAVDYQVWIEVIRLDADPKGDVTLKAKWALYHQKEKKLLETKTFTQLEKAGASGYEAMTSAGSRAMAALSREIAEAITVGL